MSNISIRDMVHYDLASMTGEIAAVLGSKLYDLTSDQRRALEEIEYKYAGRAIKIVTDHLKGLRQQMPLNHRNARLNCSGDGGAW